MVYPLCAVTEVVTLSLMWFSWQPEGRRKNNNSTRAVLLLERTWFGETYGDSNPFSTHSSYMTWTNCFIFLSLDVCICTLATVTVPSWHSEYWRRCFKKSGLHIAWLVTMDCCYFDPLVISLILDPMKSSFREEEGLARGHRDSMWRSQHRACGLWTRCHHSSPSSRGVAVLSP